MVVDCYKGIHIRQPAADTFSYLEKAFCALSFNNGKRTLVRILKCFICATQNYIYEQFLLPSPSRGRGTA